MLSETTTIEKDLERYILEINLDEKGTYNMEIECLSGICILGDYFTSLIVGNIKEIDLSENIYLNNLYFETGEKYILNQYHVHNITKDTYVYFYHDNLRNYEYHGYQQHTYYEICEEGKNCTKNIQIYKFEKDKTYTIHFYPYDEYYHYNNEIKENNNIEGETVSYEETDNIGPNQDKDYYSDRYYYGRYAFFPINENTFENLDYGVYTFEGPKIVTTPIDNKQRYILSDELYYRFGNQTNEEIKFDNINKLENIKFSESYNKNCPGNYSQIIILIPREMNVSTKLIVVNEYEKNPENEIIIPSKTSKIIKFDKYIEYGIYNYLCTFNSEQNIKLLFSDSNDGTNLIIQNTAEIPLYAPSSDKDYKIIIKEYVPKYAFFGAINPYLFNTYYSYYAKSIKSDFDLNNYVNWVPANIRINSN